MRPSLVEFIGPPGAGKTTLASVAADELRREGKRILTRMEYAQLRASRARSPASRAVAFARFVAENPGLLADAHTFAWSLRPRGRERMRRAAGLARACAFGQDAHAEARRSGCLLLLDQGPLQAVWSIALGAATPLEERLPRVLRRCLVPRPDMIVLLDVPAEVAIERVRARSTASSRLDRMPLDDAEEALARHVHDARRIAEAFAEMHRVPLLRLDGTRSLERNASRLCGAIVRLDGEKDEAERFAHPTLSAGGAGHG